MSRIHHIVVTGRPNGPKDPVHSVARKLQATLSKHLSPKSKKAVVQSQTLYFFENVLSELRDSLRRESEHIVCLLFVGPSDDKCSLLMESDDGMEEVNPTEIIQEALKIRSSTTIVCAVHYFDSTVNSTLDATEATELANSLLKAGAVAAAVSYQQSLFMENAGVDAVLDNCLQGNGGTLRTGFTLVGDWPSDKKVWRPPSPVASSSHQRDDDADTFRASKLHDAPVLPPTVVHDRDRASAGASFEMMFRPIGSKPIGPTSATEVLSKGDRIAVLGALKEFPLCLELFNYDAVQVKSVQVVLAEKTPPRMLQPNEYWCSACESVVSGKPNWDKHLVSNPHQKRCEQGVIATYHCVACAADICGEINLSQHILGAKHKRKADCHQYSCSICKQDFGGQTTFVEHRRTACVYMPSD